MLGDQNESGGGIQAEMEDKTHSLNDISSNLVAELNPPQQEAVLHGSGPILVLAGAGSGKTRVLTHRVANLVLNHSVWPDRILAVTFTNKAAEEMRHRLFTLLGERASRIWISTFHSAGLRILRHNATHLGYSNRFIVYDDQDTKGVVKQVLRDLAVDEERYPLDAFLRAIDRAKNNLITPADAAQKTFNVETDLQAQVYDRYQKHLLQADAMDFGDLLMNAVRVLQEFPEVLDYYRHTLHYLLVDEFQDTNKAQYRFIRLLAEPRRNLFVVGDDDQSIYGFRGANITNILEFEKDYPNTKVIKLEQNYRSTATILNAAHGVIEKNKTRKAKKLWTSGAAGERIRTFIGYDENMEAEFIAAEIKRLASRGMPYSQIAVLYRTNAQTRALEESLVRAKVPYKIFGGLKFFDRKEIKDILGYLRLLAHPSDNQAFQRVVNTPPRGIGAQAVQEIIQESQSRGVSYLEAALGVATSNKSVRKFVELIADFKLEMGRVSLGTLIGLIVERSEYGPKLAAMKDPAAHSRIENLQELESLGRTMEREGVSTETVIKDFLDRISLTSSADIPANESGAETGEVKAETVSLMTLHLAKGLEFPAVFLSGMEDGILPHYRSLDDPSGLEEERRLCYVGITRAMKVLYLTRAYQRGMFSSGGTRTVSRFAKDVDAESLEAVGSELSQGASFMSGYPRFSFDDDQENRSDEGRESRWVSKKRSSSYDAKEARPSVSLEQIKNLLTPADSIQKQPSTPKEYFDKSPAALEQLQSGVRVIHPTFGRGVIESVQGETTSAMVVIAFDTFTEHKKLVYRFAKLVLE